MALSAKHRIFCEEYIRTWNATEAYLAAYPKSSRDAARRNASRLMTNDDIRAEISERVAERTMGADEVLVRLAEQARAEYSAYFLPNGTVDLARLIQDGKAHLIKRIKITQWGTNVEFHDPHAAKELVGKHHGLFDKRGSEEEPVHNVEWTVEQWKAEQEKRRKEAAKTMGIFDDEFDEPNGDE